jgi:formylglycine-generating enzyme required for sulfatase activity
MDTYVQSAPVGSFAANAFGLHDTLGNVFEWVGDCWHDDYTGTPDDGSARVDGDCSQRELRGGSWFTAPAFVRVSYRNRFAADYRSTSVGFRLVRGTSR